MQWVSMLSWWQWTILACVPPAIIALYFLKLKRVPIEVPSTFLWRKSIEDLHVNSLWQKLRKNLLLWLQLLLLALIIFALLNPSVEGEKFSGERFVFMIDQSASMSTLDGEAGDEEDATRLGEAKYRVAQMIEAMDTGDKAMIIRFSDKAKVVQEYTTNKTMLLEQLKTIQPTARRTSIASGLRLAAGLANPSQTATEAQDAAAAEAKPAQLYVLSDFKFPDVSDFSLGNLDPQFEMVGSSKTGNVGIVAFSTRRHDRRPDQLNVFAQIENFTDEDVDLTLNLHLDGRWIDGKEATIPAGKSHAVPLAPINDIETGVLRLTHDFDDAMQVDNEAWAVVNPPHRSRVLFVTPGNVAWRRAFDTGKTKELTNVDFTAPPELKTEAYKKKADTGHYALIIYDRCQPAEMPQCNTLFMGAMPPGDRWQKGDEIEAPQIIDTERTHPLMHLLELGDVAIWDAFKVTPPSGGSTLIDSHQGPIFAIGPREGFEDAVLGFEFESIGDDGQRQYNTTWPLRRSFPVFVQEIILYLGTRQEETTGTTVPPGQSFVIYDPIGPDELTVRRPDGNTSTVRHDDRRRYNFSRTDEPGIYEVINKNKTERRFSVNLFSSLESDIKPVSGTAAKRIGNVDVDVKAKPDWEISRRELWRLLALLGLVVLAAEWYIYNRRVYV
jgi:hypothetical protein